MSGEAPAVADTPLWDIWQSMHFLPALTVADEVGVFDALGAQAATADELGQRLGLNPRAMRALLGMHASLGFLRVEDGRYAASDLARAYLAKASPFYWGPVLARSRRNPKHAEIMNALHGRTATGAHDAQGRPIAGASGAAVDDWSKGEMGLERARGEAAFMHANAQASAAELARLTTFDDVKRLLDVGAGSGVYSTALARERAALSCTLLDLPAMCEVASGYVAAAGAAAHVSTHPANMFHDPWPGGHDAVLFSNIFHDWSFETCTFLARAAFDALPIGGRVFVHEMLVDESGPPTTAALSMMMVLYTQGQQLTFGELKSILEGAGFTGIEARAAAGYYSITTGYKR